MSVLFFSHGKFSHPKSKKIQLLSSIARNLGATTQSIDYRACADVSARVQLLHQQTKDHSQKELILVGSNMGGYVASVVASAQPVAGLFLMAPAFYLPDYPVQRFAPKTNNITLVHGWQDKTVPYQQAIQFGQQHSPLLHFVDDSHHLNHSYDFLELIFTNFLNRTLC